MILRLNGDPGIENLRSYPSAIVEKLRGLLAAGTPAQADPNRQGFYDVKDGSRVFYIHISPVSGRILLLASWLEDTPALASPPFAAARNHEPQFRASGLL